VERYIPIEDALYDRIIEASSDSNPVHAAEIVARIREILDATGTTGPAQRRWGSAVVEPPYNRTPAASAEYTTHMDDPYDRSASCLGDH
jgi:hypothetical protein